MAEAADRKEAAAGFAVAGVDVPTEAAEDLPFDGGVVRGEQRVGRAGGGLFAGGEGGPGGPVGLAYLERSVAGLFGGGEEL